MRTCTLKNGKSGRNRKDLKERYKKRLGTYYIFGARCSPLSIKEREESYKVWSWTVKNGKCESHSLNI